VVRGRITGLAVWWHPSDEKQFDFRSAIVPADGINAAAYSLDFGTFR